jgi:hypothetical protein
MRSLCITIIPLITALTAACGQSDPGDLGPATDGVDSGTEETGAESETGAEGETGEVPTHTVSGWVLRALGPGDAVVGATICVRDQAPDFPCAVTDDAGMYVLEGVPEGPLVLDGEHPDYPPHLMHQLSGAEEGVYFAWTASEDIGPLGGLIGTAVDLALGQFGDTIVDEARWGVAGAQASLDPADSETGAVYADAQGVPNLGLTETSDSGIVGFINVAPGVHRYTVTHPVSTCVNPLEIAGEVVVQIEAGRVSAIPNTVCTQ